MNPAIDALLATIASDPQKYWVERHDAAVEALAATLDFVLTDGDGDLRPTVVTQSVRKYIDRWHDAEGWNEALDAVEVAVSEWDWHKRPMSLLSFQGTIDVLKRQPERQQDGQDA